MIELHRLKNTDSFWLNHRHIEIVESLPDTVITLTNERKYIVKESPEEIEKLILAYHKKIFRINLPESVDI
ncbi:MAG: flagellar FlbD family protein [Spirochaetia bacterium]|nr:flagellar FlbD family protein [Spirochaetia bacterium]